MNGISLRAVPDVPPAALGVYFAVADPINLLRNSPQFLALLPLLQKNRHILKLTLQGLGKKHPDILQLIKDHKAEFLQLIYGPVDDDDISKLIEDHKDLFEELTNEPVDGSSDGYKKRQWDLKQLIGSGGMPSSHLATVTSLATAVGFHDDFGGSPFATALVLACVVMYDAFGVRLHAGRQAEVLNQIVYELPVEHPLAESKPLRELLWHTPTQVIAGSFLGLVTVIVGHSIVASGTAHD